MAQSVLENNQTIDIAEIMNISAFTLFKSKQYELARRQMSILVDMYPTDPNVRFNAAKTSYYAQAYEEAIGHIDTAMLFGGENVEFRRDKVLYLMWAGRYDESVELLMGLPRDDRTMFNLGWHLLRDGDVRGGFEAIDCGRNISCWGSIAGIMDKLPAPLWDASIPLNGLRVLVINEGGYGDEIIFSRFIERLGEMGAVVTVNCSSGMTGIMSRVKGVSYVTTTLAGNYNFVIPSMSLPRLLDVHALCGSPYISPTKAMLEKWAPILNTGKPNIGIRWQGGKLYEHDQRRTLPAGLLAERAMAMGDVAVFSLQKDSDVDCPAGVIDLSNELSTWEDTLAVVSLLDHVVTSCTSIAHLSGAVGTDTAVLVPVVPYFTWATGEGRTPWYDSVTVFKQEKGGEWADEISRAIDAVGKKLTKGNSQQ